MPWGKEPLRNGLVVAPQVEHDTSARASLLQSSPRGGVQIIIRRWTSAWVPPVRRAQGGRGKTSECLGRQPSSLQRRDLTVAPDEGAISHGGKERGPRDRGRSEAACDAAPERRAARRPIGGGRAQWRKGCFF